MSIKYILLIIAILAYIEHCIESFLSNRQKIKGAVKFKWTTPMLLGVGSVVYFGSMIESLVINRNINFLLSFTGFILLVTRLALKLWTLKALGKYWSPNVEIRETQRVIKTGPFKYVRHPSYLSGIMEIIGIALLVNAYYVLFSICLIFFICVFIRIRVEEKILIETFGQEYENYKKEVGALFPILRIN